MTENEKIVYANTCEILDEYITQIKKNIKRAFEQHAVNYDNCNPMYIGYATDIVAASLRCSLKDISPNVGNKDVVIKLSEQMFHGFVSEEKELRFIEETFKQTKN